MSETSSLPRRPAFNLLLVDDEPGIVTPMARYFGRVGFHTDVAEEPELAAALVEFWRYDAIVLDLRLTPWGDGSGLDLVRRIRERSPWTSIVVLSAHLTDDVEREARRRGADAVLCKPQPLAQVARVLAGLMGGGAGAARGSGPR